jgi:hypothetical protein
VIFAEIIVASPNISTAKINEWIYGRHFFTCGAAERGAGGPATVLRPGARGDYG